MPSIAEIRQKYPQYEDMSDELLADALHRKYYSDMPREEFNAKIGVGQSKGYDGGAFNALTEGSQAGLMFGFDDEIGAAMMAPIKAAQEYGFRMPSLHNAQDYFRLVGDQYNSLQQENDQRKAARREEHPVASIAGEVAGGLATGAGATKAGLTLAAKPAASMGTRIAAGTAEGAAYGGLAGAGEANPGERLAGAAEGAAYGGAIGGTVGAVGGALAKRTAQKAANAAAPDASELKNIGQQLYKAAEQEGVRYRQPAVNQLRQNLKLAAGRINDRLRPKTAGFMDDIDAMVNGDLSLEEFDEFRKSLSLEMRRANPDDARTLGAMQRVADAWADKVQKNPMAFTGDAKKATGILKEARKVWSQHKKASVLEKIMDQADVDGQGRYTQSGFANAVRREMNKLYKAIQKGKEKGWTEEEVALIRQMAKGGSNSTVVNLMAKFAPRGVVSIIGGQAMGMGLPGVGNVLVPLAGHVAGNAADAGALQAAQTLRNAAAMGVAPKSAPLPALPNRLAPLIPGTAEASTGIRRRINE